MGETGVTLEALRAGFEAWSGSPVAVSEMRHNAPDQDTDADAAPAPAEMDILYFQPQEGDNLPEDEFFTTLATAGLSTHTMSERLPRVELVLDVRGRRGWDDLRLLGVRLAQLAVAPFYKETPPFEPEQVLRDVSFPLFAGMDCALVTEWGMYPPHEQLPQVDPPVYLLSIHPIYADEADVIERVGALEAARRFRAAGVEWDNPDRPPARLDDLPPLPLGPQAESDVAHVMEKSGDAAAGVVMAIEDTWWAIEEWYREHAPRLHADLGTGLSEEQIRALEERLGLLLPSDYKASLRLHNGDVSVNDYHYLRADVVTDVWDSLTKRSEEGQFVGREVDQGGAGIIQDTWWHRGWIPFLEDSGGNMFCIDTVPAAEGVAGQVVQIEIGAGPFPTAYPSFLAWLREYKDDLYRGKYIVDEDGLLQEV